MKKIILVILSLFLLSSCWNKNYNSEIYSDSEVSKNCIEPYNPYSEWWHYAGYEWAREKWRVCSGNSDSFIEWCEEYYTQLDDYNNCIN